MAITTPPMGIGEAFGMKKEVTFGTAVAPDVWWRPISNTLKRKDPVLPLSGPTGSALAKTTTRGFRGRPDISGTVVVEADYDYIGHLLTNTLGAAVDSGAGPILHTFTYAATIPATTPASFTAARITELEQFQYSGCMIDALEFSGAENRIVTVSMDIVAQQGGAAAVADTIGTLSTAPFVEFHDSVIRADFSATGTTLTNSHDQNAGAEAVDWTLRFDNGYRRQQAAGNGVRGDREYVYAGYRGITLTVSRDYFDDNFYDIYMSNATGASSAVSGTFATFGINLTSGETVSGGNFSLDVQLSAGHVADGMNEYPGGPDILSENIVIEAGYNGSDAPAVIVLTNGTASY